MRELISTESAPAAIGPYSQAVRCGSQIYTSGQIALDPRSGELVEGGIEAETERVLLNLDAVLRAAGSSLANVLKVTVYLDDLVQFDLMNSVFRRFFGEALPARTTVQAKLPRGATVEIDAVALVE